MRARLYIREEWRALYRERIRNENIKAFVAFVAFVESFWRQPLSYVLPPSSKICHYAPRDFNSTHAIRCLAASLRMLVSALAPGHRICSISSAVKPD